MKFFLRKNQQPHQKVLVADRFICSYQLCDGKLTNFSISDTDKSSTFKIEVETEDADNHSFLGKVCLTLTAVGVHEVDDNTFEEYVAMRSAMAIIALSLSEYDVEVSEAFNVRLRPDCLKV